MLYFLDKNITLRREKYLDENRSAYSATGTAVGYPCSWQEPSPETQQLYQGEIGNMYSCFVDILCPVESGDHIVKSGIEYAVRDIKVMDFGCCQYKKIIAVRGM